MEDLKKRLELAERVCLMFGWSPSRTGKSDREDAAHELWVEWLNEYERQGGSLLPKHHPDLSDERIKELAQRRKDIRASTLAKIDQVIVTDPA